MALQSYTVIAFPWESSTTKGGLTFMGLGPSASTQLDKRPYKVWGFLAQPPLRKPIEAPLSKTLSIEILSSLLSKIPPNQGDRYPLSPLKPRIPFPPFQQQNPSHIMHLFLSFLGFQSRICNFNSKNKKKNLHLIFGIRSFRHSLDSFFLWFFIFLMMHISLTNIHILTQ